MRAHKTKPDKSPATQGPPTNGKAGQKKLAKTAPAKNDARTPRLSAIDAAAKVLGEKGQPMRCPEMIEAMARKGYWKSPAGKTPAATLYASILRELKIRGAKARFRKTGRGPFARTKHRD
jgi:hypothetical protein